MPTGADVVELAAWIGDVELVRRLGHHLPQYLKDRVRRLGAVAAMNQRARALRILGVLALGEQLFVLPALDVLAHQLVGTA